MTSLELQHISDESFYGGKATQLGAALRAGLPVPPGHGLSAPLVDAVARGERVAEELVRAIAVGFPGPMAVRSSAVGEDSAGASFAGQHATKLNVRSPEHCVRAVREVWASGRSPAALAYRRKLGLPEEPRVGVVVQSLVTPTCAGVMFTRDPMSGADVRVIEAAWGLGEVVVSGLVTPDHYRVGRDGAVLAREAGTKDLELLPSADGGTEEREVEPHRVRSLCLNDAQLRALHDLALACDTHFGATGHDVEWAFAAGRLYLLQRRAMTGRRAH